MITKIGLYYDPRKIKPWVVRWFGEYDPTTGQQKRYSKSFKLKRDAEVFQSGKSSEFRQGQQRDKPEEITLRTFCADWLKVRKPEFRPQTVMLYENTIGRLLDYFGADTALHQITARGAAKFIAELKRLDGDDGELSAWARHRVLRNCRTIFGSAVDWGLIGKNTFLAVKRPKLSISAWHYLTPDEYRKLLDVAPLRYKALYSLAYCCGLRLGEVLSLRWDNVDFERAEVRIVNRPTTATTPPFFIKDNESRTIPMPQHTRDILTDLKTYNEATDGTPYVMLNDVQYATMLAKWVRYREQGRTWLNQDMQNNTLVTFKRHVKKAEIKPNGTLSLHTLRKSCITNWANEINNPEVVRVLAGHSDLKTTMRFYSQASTEQKAKAAAAIDHLLNTTDARVTPEGDFGHNSSR
jgi:integrase